MTLKSSLNYKKQPNAQNIKWSIEYFPPRGDVALENFKTVSLSLQQRLNPKFVSVTYGAGGTTKDATMEAVMLLQQKHTAWPIDYAPPAAHITAAGASKADIQALAKTYWDAGIRHLVAIRGDQPHNPPGAPPPSSQLRYGSDLVNALKQVADFDLSVGCYPNKHPESASLDDDLAALRYKMDQGADRAISQFFFNADDFLKFRDQARKHGITKPIIPGILPFINATQTLKFAKLCQTPIPAGLHHQLESAKDNAQDAAKLGIEVATKLIEQLIKEGVDHYHLYSLNRSMSILAIMDHLSFNIPPQACEQHVAA
ncbi:MAG: methylenetetrahydrofolate reductase [Alphaproteobacteria bacterium]